jgi:predicted acetyltransferase
MPPPIDDFVYEHADLPREFEIQVWAFARLVWGENVRGDARFGSRLWADPPPTHFVRAAGEVLISHVQVFPFRFDTDRRVLRVGGVGAVLTYPQFRGEGHASALMRRAAEHIDRTAEVGVLFCAESNVPFYERFDWTTLPRERVLVKGEIRDDRVMILGEERLVPDPFRLDWSW